MNKARKKVLALVLTLSCATAGLGLFTACNDGGETSEHTHSYTQWAHDNEEHWKVCPDDGAIDRRGLQIPCLYAYCPGCRVTSSQLKEEDPDARCTPALEIDGELRFWDVPASDEDLQTALSALV